MNGDENIRSGEMPSSMSQQRPLKTVREAVTLARIVWFALVVSQVVYLYVGRMLVPELAQGTAGENAVAAPVAPGFMDGVQNPIGLPFLAAGMMALVLSFVLPKLISPGPVPVAPGMPAVILDPQRLPYRLRTRLMRFILGAALNESVALIGLVAGFVTMKNPAFGSAFVFAALAGMLARWPREETFADPSGARR